MKKTLSAFLVLASLLACDGPVPTGLTLPLLDDLHAPDVLVERPQLARPPAIEGGRFLSGWVPWKAEGHVVLSPASAGETCRIELVNVHQSPRTVVLDLLPGATAKGVRVEAGGRKLGTTAVTDPLTLTVPMNELELGRIPLDLTFEDGEVGVVAAAVRPVGREGEAHVEGADLVQSGDSLVDLVQPLRGARRLVGAFVPPSAPKPSQRFELTVEREDGTPVRRFSWSPSFWNRLRGRRTISLPLREVEGFVRVRLRALGDGPPGRWEKLALAGGKEQGTVAGMRGETTPPRLVVVYVLDALRADAVGHLGGPAGASPTIDRLAAEGMTFTVHRSVAPNTLPATKALFTGKTFVSRGGWKLQADDGPTLAELFRAAGYRTGLFSGNVHVSPAFGTDRGFEHAAAEALVDEGAAEKPVNDNAAHVHRAALSWLRTLAPHERAFLYVHTMHPHNPYAPPEPFRSRFTAGIASGIGGDTATLLALKHKRREASPADRERLRGLYVGSLAYNDAALRGLLEALATWADPRETVIAVTSDHGEELFDHGGLLHGYTLYEEMLRIPLVLWAPGRLRHRLVEARSDTLDLHRTLLDLAGIEAASEGRSLLAPLTESPRLAAASSLKGGMFAVRSARWKVVWAPRTGINWGMGEGIGRSRDADYLFDLKRDPRETVNLAGEGDLEAQWLRSRLLAWALAGRAEGEAEEAPVDEETRKRLEALGYGNPGG